MARTAPNDAPERQLAALRARIDALDDKLVRLFVERMGIIHQVAELKGKHWPNDCHIRSGREGEMHRRIAKAFKGSNFPPYAAVAIWRQLIGSATNAESPLNIAFLAGQAHHYWLAREYFGPLVNLTSVAAPALVEDSNVLLLPAPGEPGIDWWRNPIQHKGKSLALFACLPLVAAPLPGEASPAVALAPLVPEPSGDDISYFTAKTKRPDMPEVKGARAIHRGTDHLLIFDGFVTPDAAKIAALKKQLGEELVALHWLGAHPRPFTPGELA